MISCLGSIEYSFIGYCDKSEGKNTNCRVYVDNLVLRKLDEE